MSSLKPITVWGHGSAPNPWKVIIIMLELGIRYELKEIDLKQVKEEPYTKLNPNGRLPTIEDPNTGVTLWESGAIVEYLIDTYDTDFKLSMNTSPEKFHLKQWLYFQTSGQGPYYGQAAWFRLFHPEQVPSAILRYQEQTLRVVSVLNDYLRDHEYLVGGKVTYADLSFVTWNTMLEFLAGDKAVTLAQDYPHFHAWNQRLLERPSVKMFIDFKSTEHKE